MSWTFGPFGDKMGLILPLEEGSILRGFLNEPVSLVAAAALSKFLAPFAVYNFIVLLSFPLAVFFAHRFFRRFFDSWISFALSLVFTFSPYHILKSYNHANLAQIWVFPLCFSALLDFDQVQFCRDAPPGRLYGSVLKLSAVAALTTLISNYYGYFMLIVTVLFFTIRWFQSPEKSVLAQFTARGLKSAITPYLLLTVCYLLVILPFLFPYLRANYLEGALPSPDGLSLEVKRGVSDFVIFTARPWYFITPSVYHPFLGKFAEGIHRWFANTGYFLFDDFFAQEHSGIFLGWTNLILAGYAVLAPPRKTAAGKNLRVEEEKPKGWGMRRLGNRRSVISIFLWLALTLAILSGPPFFTIAGFKIYLPSYLLMKVFPMFRTLARLGVPILLCLLVLTGYGLNLLKEHFRDRRFLPMLLTTSYLLLALFEFYNPPTIVDVPERGSPEYNKLIEIKEIGDNGN